MQVISYDYKKVHISFENGNKVFSKFTTEKEYFNILRAEKYISKKNNISGCRFEIKIPKIIEWRGDISLLKLDFCEGENLELLIRYDIENRSLYVKLINLLLKYMKDNKFWWEDFSPRNIILNFSNDIIYFVDFEKNLILGDEDSVYEMFVLNIIEELSAFLLKNELEYLYKIFNEIKPNKNGVYINNIKSRRRKLLLYHYFGKKDFYLWDELKYVNDLLIGFIKAKCNNKEIYYPIIEIEENLNLDGVESYVNRIIKKNKIK